MPETARRQRERQIKIELLQTADMYVRHLTMHIRNAIDVFSCVSTLNYVGNSLFDSFSPFDANCQQAAKVDPTKKPVATTSTIVPALFNCLIIDEAGQCIEIDNYIPLRLGMNRIILVGDPEQLYALCIATAVRLHADVLDPRQFSLDEHWKLASINPCSSDFTNCSNTI